MKALKMIDRAAEREERSAEATRKNNERITGYIVTSIIAVVGILLAPIVSSAQGIRQDGGGKSRHKGQDFCYRIGGRGFERPQGLHLPADSVRGDVYEEQKSFHDLL